MLGANNPYRQQVAWLLEVLPLVGREDCFALKGGTAINLFVRNMPRLSVDIDLAYLPVGDRDVSLPDIAAALERIASALELRLRGSKVQRTIAGGQIIKLVAWRNGVRVKIEVSPVMRGCVREPSVQGVSAAVEDLFGYVEVPVVHADDLYAGKLCAALDRQHSRDLFDVRLLLENEGIEAGLLDVFVVYLLSSDRPLAELLSPNRKPLAATFEAEFTGMTLIPVTLAELEQTRETMINLIRERLTDPQRQFLLGFKQGEPDWGLLNPPGIENLPAVQWKLLNIRRMTPARREQALENLRQVLWG
ncbi:MAG TPA: nucleotidyl transferase AbiEii/AbiGii toxin family protein [Gallionellaceae bacterium]|nr:nucleotidyl transferase AbiEii/AbiGii toxin family protein [Gallionellaceae bacterium]